MIFFNVNPFKHQQAPHFGVLNYEKQHKEGTCKVSGRSVILSAFYADFCLCPKLVIITTLSILNFCRGCLNYLALLFNVHIVSCEPLSDPVSGQFTASTNGVITTATFKCDLYTSLRGERVLSCLTGGTWDHSPPLCGIFHLFIIFLFLVCYFNFWGYFVVSVCYENARLGLQKNQKPITYTMS